mmetsp:Transcript_11442/g.47929  ORF Transcript_11442/g.47929 Transcript_11442/m.47929 type:complete len:254 (+) Transcript_11442:74-835(+)
MATTPLSTRVLLYPLPTRARPRYSASRRAEVVSDAYRDARDVAVAPPRLARLDTRAIRPVEPSARLLSKSARRRFSAAANSSAGSLPPARGCRHASSASVQTPARSHVAAPDPPRLLRVRRARRSRRSAPRRRRLTPRRPSHDEKPKTKPTDARHDDDARAPPRDDVYRRIYHHRRRVLHLRRRVRRRTSRARLRAAPGPEAPVLRYGVRHAGGFLRPGFARPRPRRAVPRRDRPRRALHHRARRRRPILTPG